MLCSLKQIKAHINKLENCPGIGHLRLFQQQLIYRYSLPFSHSSIQMNKRSKFLLTAVHRNTAPKEKDELVTLTALLRTMHCHVRDGGKFHWATAVKGIGMHNRKQNGRKGICLASLSQTLESSTYFHREQRGEKVHRYYQFQPHKSFFLRWLLPGQAVHNEAFLLIKDGNARVETDTILSVSSPYAT